MRWELGTAEGDAAWEALADGAEYQVKAIVPPVMAEEDEARRADREAAARVRQAPAGREVQLWEGEELGEELGFHGPDRPEPEDITLAEDVAAEAWLDDPDPGSWPPRDPWVRRGLHNLCCRMAGVIDGGGYGPLVDQDAMVMVRARRPGQPGSRCSDAAAGS